MEAMYDYHRDYGRVSNSMLSVFRQSPLLYYKRFVERSVADEALIQLRAALHEIPKTCERAAVAILNTIDIVDGLKRRIGNVA